MIFLCFRLLAKTKMLKLSLRPFGPYTVCVVIIFTHTGKLIQNELQFAFGNHYIQSTVSCVVMWDMWPCSILYCPHNSMNVFPFSMFSITLSHGGILHLKNNNSCCTNFIKTIPVTIRALYSSENAQGAKSWFHTNWLRLALIDRNEGP